MTLLDTEQSYVESLRTLMQVRLPPAGPRRGHAGSRRLSGMREQTCVMDREPRSERRRDGPGTLHPSRESPRVTALQEEASSGAGENAEGPQSGQSRCPLRPTPSQLPRAALGLS